MSKKDNVQGEDAQPMDPEIGFLLMLDEAKRRGMECCEIVWDESSHSLYLASQNLQQQGFVAIEDDNYSLTPLGQQYVMALYQERPKENTDTDQVATDIQFELANRVVDDFQARLLTRRAGNPWVNIIEDTPPEGLKRGH